MRPTTSIEDVLTPSIGLVDEVAPDLDYDRIRPARREVDEVAALQISPQIAPPPPAAPEPPPAAPKPPAPAPAPRK